MSYFNEQWKPVVGFEDIYSVSDFGRVRREPSGRLLSPPVNSTGYLTIGLSKHGCRKTYKVHSLVCEAFIGPRPSGYQVNHIDTDRKNAKLSNLEYLPPRVNRLLAQYKRYENDAKHGVRVERFCKKLTEQDVVRIREMAETMGSRRIGLVFGLHHSTVRDIIRRDLWKHFA